MACRKEGSKRAKLNIGMHLERTPPELAVDSGKRKISNKTTIKSKFVNISTNTQLNQKVNYHCGYQGVERSFMIFFFALSFHQAGNETYERFEQFHNRLLIHTLEYVGK